ncbi:hypothetical protein [Leptolyngbya iicbica]|uniref:Uncharacterized protein n=2 Tax=Cyanophyceae TaxID=3028117 RepID=A0A4Q7EAG3_9CYAN|nr:hypothetical protein [Leptolyngbya sp. LK]RZM79581.1 hypothetical protein DYY88_12770 [Leptolyngbya sp. LK]
MAAEISNNPESEISKTQRVAIALRYFLLGAVLSGIPVLAYLWLSVDMTYGSWAALETGRLVGAIAIPLVAGLLAARFGQRAIRVLSDLLESANLPF